MSRGLLMGSYGQPAVFLSFCAGCSIRSMRVRPRIQEPICYLLGELGIEDPPKSRVNPTANHRLTLDLWLAKDNRFLNPKSSYKRILMAPPCRLIQNQLAVTTAPVFDWQLILGVLRNHEPTMEPRDSSPTSRLLAAIAAHLR